MKCEFCGVQLLTGQRHFCEANPAAAVAQAREAVRSAPPAMSQFHAATERFVGELRLYLRHTTGSLTEEVQALHAKLSLLEAIIEPVLGQLRRSTDAQRPR